MTEIAVIKKQSTDLQSKLMVWFLFDRDRRHKRVNGLPMFVRYCIAFG